MLLLCRRFLTLFQERVRLIAFRLKLFGKSYGRNCRRCRWLRHLLFFSRQRQNSPKKNKPKMKRVFLMILKCSVEPKRRYLAQSCYFDIKFEPSWLTVKICTNGKRSSFRYRAAEEFAEISVFESHLFLCPAGRVLRYNKQRLWQSKVRHRVSLVRGESPETPLKLKSYGGKINEKKKQSNQCKIE